MVNKDKTAHGFMVGQLVYLYVPSGAILTAPDQKRFLVNLLALW